MPAPHNRPRAVPVFKKGRETVLAFQDALISLLESTPWREITLRAVTDITGLAVGTVYNYYKNLDELALAAADRLEDEGRPRPPHLNAVVTLIRWERKHGLGIPVTDE